MSSSYKFNDCNTYQLIVNNKKIYIINFGEIHGEDSKINFKVFDNHKTMFYIETPFKLFNKQFKYKYFKKINSPSITKIRKQNNIQIYSPDGYNNIYYINKYFAYWFKKNNYKFNDKNDNNVINRCNPYNKLWNYCPCEFRDGTECFYAFTEPLYQLLYYYLRHIQYAEDFNLSIDEFLKQEIDNDISCLKLRIPSYDIMKQEFIKAINSNKYDMLKFNDKIYRKIYLLLVKYYNNLNYRNYVNNPTFKNLDKLFKNINLTDMTIDLFNIITFFYYEDKLKKYPSIIEFIKYYYEVMIYSMTPYYLANYIIGPYDIILYINLNDNLQNYEYHVIYNGTFHRYIFQSYINFMYLNY